MAGGFDPSSPYYDTTRGLRGGDPISSQIEYTSHENVFGATVNDGKADAFRKVQAGLNPESLNKKAAAWDLVQTDHNQAAGDLAAIRDEVFAAWQGDDADQAQKTFNQTVTSADALRDYTKAMHDGTSHLATAVTKAKGTSADGPGFGSKLAGGLGLGGGDGDGDADFKAYGQLCQDVSNGRGKLPTQVQWQNKADAANSPVSQASGYDPNAGNGGVGGVNSPGASGTPQHVATTTPHLTKTPTIKQPNTDDTGTNTNTNTDDTGTDDTGTGLDTPNYGDTGDTSVNGSGIPAFAGGGAGSPGLDTSSSLAGYDPSGGGAGGGGLGGGTAGGLASGGAGSGVGAGSGLDGGAAGGLASGGGLGAGAGAGAGGGGSAGRGGVGGQAAPMRGGGGGGGDDSERERSTWLNEDDDVWGESDAPPSVIS